MSDQYTASIKEQFSHLVINLVRHDTSPTGLPAYIEVHLGKKPKNPGALVLNLGNYIHRITGLRYQMTPEFRGKGKATTVRWFMSWDDLAPVIPNIYAAMTLPRAKPMKCDHVLPFEFHSLIIQSADRGVHAQERQAS